MKRKIWLSIIIIFIIITSSMNVQASGKSSYDINGSSYELGYEDLERIKPFFEGKEIIGVGEATHGTKEFFQMKHRLFKFLVEEMGYRAFAMEQGMSEMELINRYIQGEEDEAKNLIKALNTTWQNNEFLDFIIWTKEYNQKANDEDKIRFYGFDAQLENKTIDNIEKYFKNIDSPSFKDIFKNYNDSSKYDGDNQRFYLKVQLDLEKNEEDYISQSSEKEYLLIKKIVDNTLLYYQRSTGSDRDKKIAENIIWIKDYEKQCFSNNNIMLWGHNSHLSINRKDEFAGSYLKQEYGDKYYCLAQDFYSGYFISDFQSASKGNYK